MINTKAGLRDYILRQLGYPTIKVELTEDQLNDSIDKAIQKYSMYAHDGTVEGSLLVQIESDKFSYKLPSYINAVSGLQASSAYSVFLNVPMGYSLALPNPISLSYLYSASTIDVQSMMQRMAAISTIKSIFDVRVNYTFNSNKKELKFFEPVASNFVLLDVGMEYIPDEEDYIFDNRWVKDRAVASAKFLWGQVVGKYSSNLVGGMSINYDRLISEAEAEIDRLDTELIEKMQEPLGVWVF